ncbi:MAG TPA: homocysteine S-methyltransferase family protein [Acidobacteriota bacterium]|nr:homocysteine S-methyltransferase family protein [Acidobacteriota bacterium]
MAIAIKSITTSSCIVSDGGWGTELQKLGLEPGSSPDQWNLTQPEKVARVARSYVEAGSDIILTNTFGANKFMLSRHGLESRLEEINLRGAQISREAAGESALVFGSMGPTGKLLLTGEISEDEVADSYHAQAEALWKGGSDALLIETMSDVGEMKIAARAVREASPLPLVISMTFDSGKEKMQTMTGVKPEQAVSEMEDAGAWMVGANCGVGPELYVRICRRMRAVTSKPIWAKANAGIPRATGDSLVYPLDPESFSGFAGELRNAGANVIGGCCGTSPEYIRRLVERLAD